jgi:hypothetical protein
VKRYGTARVININHPRQTTNVERTAGDEPLAKNGSPAFDTPVRILVHSYRCRLCDVDGISSKALLDGLVLANVIANDTTKEVQEVRYLQTKVKTKAEEQAVITVERV